MCKSSHKLVCSKIEFVIQTTLVKLMLCFSEDKLSPVECNNCKKQFDADDLLKEHNDQGCGGMWAAVIIFN